MSDELQVLGLTTEETLVLGTVVGMASAATRRDLQGVQEGAMMLMFMMSKEFSALSVKVQQLLAENKLVLEKSPETAKLMAERAANGGATEAEQRAER